MKGLVDQLKRRKIRIGIATSVANSFRDEAEIYPRSSNKEIKLTREQIGIVELFS